MKLLSEINIRDPFVLLDNDTYYLYGTDEHCWGKGYKFDCYKSQDLIKFEGPFTIFEKTEDFWADQNYWSPEVHKYDGKYYLFASIKSKRRCRGTQIFLSDTPDGKFVPLTQYPVTPETWECLDGTLYVDEANVPYIVYCHEWVQIEDGTICYQQLSPDLKNTVTTPIVLFKASEVAWTTPLEYQGVKYENTYVTDGPFLYKLEKEKLVLLWSSFRNGQYAIGQSISKNGIQGPFLHIEEPLYQEDGGHGMVFKDKNQQLKLAIHAPNNPTKERTLLIELKENMTSLSRQYT